MRRIIFSSSWSRVKQALELDIDWHTSALKWRPAMRHREIPLLLKSPVTMGKRGTANLRCFRSV